MLLVIDTGNTTIAAGVFDGNNLIAHGRLSSISRTSDELGVYLWELLSTKNINPSSITGAAFASVVPSLDFAITEAIKQYFNVNPLQVSANTDTGLDLRVKNPQEVGADRIVNVFAGLHKYGSPLIVVDYGTAITFDCISPDGAYLGGVIAPGLVSGISALFSKAAKLPQVSLSIPERVIGLDTTENIQSGILYGNGGLTDRLIDLIRESDGMKAAKVVATGGHAGLMQKVSRNIEYVDNWLMLDGLRLIYERIYKS